MDRRGGRRLCARADRDPDQRDACGDHLHLRGHRVRQPRAQGRGAHVRDDEGGEALLRRRGQDEGRVGDPAPVWVRRSRRDRREGRGRLLRRSGRPHHHRRDRAQGDPRQRQAAGEGRFPRHVPQGAEERDDPPGGPRGRHDAQDHPGVDHVRQQRDRRAPAGEGDRRPLPQEEGAVPHRRRAGRRQGPDRRQRDEHRSDVDLGAQDVRAEGRRCDLCPATGAARASRGDHRRRRPRARDAQRDAQRPRDRGLREGRRALPDGDGRGEGARSSATVTASGRSWRRSSTRST